MLKVIDSSDLHEIGVRVRDIRSKRGLTQGELADKAGLAINTVSRIEGG